VSVLSIITINLNNKRGLGLTIKSVLNQTYTDFEYLIIDGGSNDSSHDVIMENNNKLSYWISEPDNGIYNAMNKGILKANGEYLLFLNSGDWLNDNGVLARIFNTPRTADIIYGHMNFVSGTKSMVRRAASENEFSLAYFLTNSLCHPATFISRRLFDSSLYDESYRIAADKKFFIDKIIFQNCTLQKVDEVITNFPTTGITSNSEYQTLIKEENDKIFTSLFPPRLAKDIDIYRHNYRDIQNLLKVKKFDFLYLVFKLLKKTSGFFQRFLIL
jgi:glycosyltransferase involved in cell wall biosynthesis